MFGSICAGVVLALAVYGLVGGFRTRAFKVGRGREPRVIALSANPVGFWVTATILSVLSGACAGVILFLIVHS